MRPCTSDKRRRKAPSLPQAERDRRGTSVKIRVSRKQSAGLGCQFEPPRIGAADDEGESGKCIRIEAEFLDHYIEGTLFTPVAPKRVSNVERGCLEAVGNGRHLRWGYKQEEGLRIDEAADEPRTGNTNDLGPSTRHPDRSSGFVTLRQLVRANEQLTALTPSLITAFEGLSIDAFLPHQGTNPLAEVQSLFADKDDRLAVILFCPRRADRASPRTGDESRIGRKIFIRPNIDNGRRIW